MKKNKKAVNIKPMKLGTGRRSGRIGYAYIAPWIIGLLVFQLIPLGSSLYYSFTNYNILGEAEFIGLTNYVNAFTKDPTFWDSLGVTLTYVFTSVPAKLIMALAMALILNSKLKGIKLFRTAYYIPSIMGASVAVSILWRFMFMKEGYINTIIEFFGGEPVDWLGSPGTAMFVIVMITVWQFGSSMVLYLAALKNVPNELYESAKIDGAGKVRRLFKITLPMISPIIFFTVIMQLIEAFQSFTAPMLITSGGPAKATYLYGMMLYDNAFRFQKMGYASALSWILFIIIIIFAVVIFKFSNAAVYYEDGGKKRK